MLWKTKIFKLNNMLQLKSVTTVKQPLKDTFIENDRTTIKRPNTKYYLEIDILIKQGNDIICGVEYNGNYYHDKEDESKETLKSELCKEAGFSLFHIWEDSVEDDLFGIIEILDEI